MSQDISIPVYFSKYNKELDTIIEDISINAINRKENSKRDSALAEIMNSISANGYQAVISGSTHTPNKQSKIPIIQGELAPMKAGGGHNSNNKDQNSVDSSNKIPLIILTAHLDTFGLVNVII